jgi:hypothetical protein
MYNDRLIYVWLEAIPIRLNSTKTVRSNFRSRTLASLFIGLIVFLLFANVLRFHQNELVGLSFRFFRSLGLYLWGDKIQKFAERDPPISVPIHHTEQSL